MQIWMLSSWRLRFAERGTEEQNRHRGDYAYKV